MIQVRLFAGAAAALGFGEVELDPSTFDGQNVCGPWPGDLGDGSVDTTVGGLRNELLMLSPGERSEKVLDLCSYLIDGSATQDPEVVVPDGSHVDVLPPFAGG